MRFPFGKHQGEELENIPDDYLLWILDNIKRLSPTLRLAIHSRLGLSPPEKTVVSSVPADAGSAITRSWHRLMTLKYHPDRGGSHESMLAVNDGADLLRKLFEQANEAGNGR